jgi:hypothetical protein
MSAACFTMVVAGCAEVDPELLSAVRKSSGWDANADNSLSGFVSDETNVWWADGPVPVHVDHADGRVTLGLIVINDLDARLVTKDGEFDLPVGSVYRIDSSEPHGTKTRKRKGGFCFIALDVRPGREPSAAEFAAQAMASLRRQFLGEGKGVLRAEGEGYLDGADE